MIPLGVLAGSQIAGSSWTPADLANLKGWWDAGDASTFTYSSGVLVSQWADKSGQGRHLAQGDTASQPSRNGTINSRTSVVFDGTSDLLSTTTFTAPATPSTLLLVGRNTASSDQRNAFMSATDGADNPHARIFRTTGGTIDIYNGAFLSTSISWGTTAAHSIVGVFNHTSSKIAADSGTWTTGDAGPLVFGNRWMMGAYRNGASEFWQGDICEVVHVEAALSDADRDAWFNYCSTKWGTP